MPVAREHDVEGAGDGGKLLQTVVLEGIFQTVVLEGIFQTVGLVVGQRLGSLMIQAAEAWKKPSIALATMSGVSTQGRSMISAVCFTLFLHAVNATSIAAAHKHFFIIISGYWLIIARTERKRPC